jgi:hypothetical protein
MLKQGGVVVAGIAFAVGGLLGWAAARTSGPEGARPGAPSWILGEGDERFARIEKHLRGLDVAMAEIGYRYTELFFAVQDGNWDYAGYQMDKIELALKLAVERRPQRAASANAFLTEDLPAVQAGVRSRETDAASEAVERLRTACMKCHVSEQVPYFTLQTPERRLTAIRPGRE